MKPVAASVYTIATIACVETITREVSTRELRSQLSDVLGRAMYAGERIGVTRNGKLAAVVVGVEDLEALEAYEMDQDIAAYRRSKEEDDGTRISLAELRAELPSCPMKSSSRQQLRGRYGELLVTVIRAAHRREVYR